MLPILFGRPLRRIHCVGVAGMGVGPLAIYLAGCGFHVTGEDDAMTDEMRVQLTRAGVAIGSMPADCELVAYSSAISSAHPTFIAATERKVPLVRRGELLAEVTRDRKLVAVCGSHGKTTTTAMLITALRRGGFPSGYVLGGLFADDTPPAAAGANDWVVAEIDESDGTIDRFSPEITVAVNLDWDHPDQYRRIEDIEAAFAALFRRTRNTVLFCDTCTMSARVVKAARAASARGAGASAAAGGGDGPSYRTFGRSGDFQSHVVAEEGSRMTLRLGGMFAPDEVCVQARGAFNASNATAALAAAHGMGVSITPAALAAYPAVRRRQSVLFSNGITVIEDYAHHPAEIRALLGTLRSRVTPPGRLVVVFQPHRFSRTAQFKADFAQVLATADRLHLLDVYSAGESPVAAGTTADLYAELTRIAPALPVSYAEGNDEAFFAALSLDVHDDDLVAFVGAGDIDKKAREWLQRRGAVAGGNSKRDLRWSSPSPATMLPAGAVALSVGGTPAPTPSSSGPAKAVHKPDWDGFVAELKPKLHVGTKLKREEPLASKTTMRVGGAARVYAEPAALADLKTVLTIAAARSIPVFILGRGSNLIVPDEGVDGVVISLAHDAWSTFVPRGNGRVWVGAGLRLKNLCGLAAKEGLAGFEFLEGIPGSVGGALRMNAGAMGGWMFDVVEEVQLITLTGEVKTMAKAAMHVDYRHCAELHEAIALGALLRPATQTDVDAVRRQMDAYARKRHETQPREPSAGCIFKNPPGTSAGRLIDECGLKGEHVGDAEVSPVHANFIVNRGHATSADVLELVRRVRARVKEKKGVDLQPEVLLYGKKWEDVL